MGAYSRQYCVRTLNWLSGQVSDDKGILGFSCVCIKRAALLHGWPEGIVLRRTDIFRGGGRQTLQDLFAVEVE